MTSAATGKTVDTLVRFTQLASSSEEPDDILPLLARTAVEEIGVAGALVFRILDGGRLEETARAAVDGWQDSLSRAAGLRLPADLIGRELADAVMDAMDRADIRVEALPLISSRDLYGALVLVMSRERALDELDLVLAGGLVDLTAIVLEKAHHTAELERRYEEARRMQEIMLRSEKLRALGAMAAGVAHDLRNVLSPLGLQLTTLERAPAKHDLVLPQMRQILSRGLGTLERLRSFSRQAPSEPQPVELNRSAREAMELARNRLMDTAVQVITELGPPQLVRADENRLVTSVLNLILNAVDAMPDGGRIWVRTGTAPTGGWLEVEDEGAGMPPEVVARLFEPFFTTKGAKGTGLGLLMVQATVHEAGGEVAVHSEPGRGTRIRLSLPRPEEGTSAVGTYA
jgi:signal transduction histidine kinase